MIYFLTTIHVIICLFLIVVVLLQSGKAADLAGAFGGMGSQTAFGPRGAATMLSKATAVAAVLFMIVSIWLGIEQGYVRGEVGSGSVIESSGVAGETTVPAPLTNVPVPDGTTVEVEPVTPSAPAPAEAPPAQPPAQ